MHSTWAKTIAYQPKDTHVFWLLIVVTLLTSIFFRLSLSYNTLHFDEAGYLFVGERLLAGAQWPTKTYVFSSDFPLVLLAFFQKSWGEYGGRWFSAIISLLSLFYFYKIVGFAKLSRKLQYLALALACIQVSHVAISRLATYDAVCFFFFLVSVYYSALSVVTKKIHWLVLSSIAFLLSVFSKYIAVAYLPVFCFFLFLSSPKKSLVFFALTFPVLVGYFLIHYHSLLVLFQGQVQGSHLNNVGVAVLIKALFLMFWPLLAFCFSVFLFCYKKLSFKVGLVFFAFATPVVAYHFYNKDFISLYKHSVYFAFALCFFTCYLASLYKKSHLLGVRFDVFLSLLVALTLANAAYWVKESELGWVNYKELYAYLDVNHDEKTNILSEDPYNFRYRYAAQLSLKNLKDVNWFDYNKDGVKEDQDVLNAAQDGYFSYIVVDETIRPNLIKKLKNNHYLARYERVFYQPDVKISALVSRNTSASIALYRRKGT